MATTDAILMPSSEPVTKIASLAATTSSAEVNLGVYQKFAIVATDTCHIRFGRTGMGAASSTDAYIAAKTKEIYDMGPEFTHVRVFNPTGAAIDVYLQMLCTN